MHFYFDESGDFSPPNDATEHKASVVVGVDIPEIIEASVFESYDNFVKGLQSEELDRGEPKGRMLTDDGRRHFCEMLAGQENVFITPAILDLTSLANGRAKAAIDSLVEKLNCIAPQCKYETMTNDVRLLARQIANLSIEQNLRMLAIAKCLFHALKHSILFRCEPEYESCWDNIIIDIDPVQQRSSSRERIVFESMMLGWITAWTHRDPIVTIEGTYSADHPFSRRYSIDGEGIDIGALLRDHIRWPSSSTSQGIQISDMCATINSLAVRRIVDTNDLRNYGMLMTRNVLAPQLAPGLITVSEEKLDLGTRYSGLISAITAARKA
jgi:hypothetical protein